MRSIQRVLLTLAALTALLIACKGSPPEPTTTSTTSSTGTSGTTSTTGTFPSIPPVVLSGNVPTVVPIPSNAPTNAPPEQFRPYFDWFSWEQFIALNWPAGTGRGNPNQPNNPTVFTSMTNSTPVTWGTYKANWELYNQYDKRPTPWPEYAVPYPPSVCPQASQEGKELLMVTKGDTELDDVVQAFSSPLVDQKSNYVFFEVRYNEAYYNFVRGSDTDPKSWLYYMQNLPIPNRTNPAPQTPLPPNSTSTADSIMLKAAWRLLANVPAAQQQRYYTQTAWVYNSATKQCTQQLVGLVGFHIAQKTKDFPEWIWSTFEQVDNVPPQVNGEPSSFNNGKDSPDARAQGFANAPNYNQEAPGQLPTNPTPTQVVRLNPIPKTPTGVSTVDVNNTFHAALPKSSPWQYYQLIITQWPSTPENPYKPGAAGGVYPGDAGGAFPVNNAVNVTMETYFQTQDRASGFGGNSCMGCHYQAAAGLRDFSWGFQRRPHGTAPPPPSKTSTASTKKSTK